MWRNPAAGDREKREYRDDCEHEIDRNDVAEKIHDGPAADEPICIEENQEPGDTERAPCCDGEDLRDGEERAELCASAEGRGARELEGAVCALEGKPVERAQARADEMIRVGRREP